MATDTEVIVRPLRCSGCDSIIRVLTLQQGEAVPAERCTNCTLDTASPRWMNGNEDTGEEDVEDERYVCGGCGGTQFTMVRTLSEVLSTDTREYDHDDDELYFNSYGEYEHDAERVTCSSCGLLARVEAHVD